MKKILILILVIGLITSLHAYTADCKAGFNGKRTQKFTIVVKNKILTRYATYGTYVSYFQYKENGAYVYAEHEITDKVYSPHEILGKFVDGKFSYTGIAYGGDIISGTCILRD